MDNLINKRIEKLERRVDEIEMFLKKFIDRLIEKAKERKEKSKATVDEYYKMNTFER